MSTQLAADPETPTRLTADKPGAWDARTWDARPPDRTYRVKRSLR